jgi:hypothetical protein
MASPRLSRLQPDKILENYVVSIEKLHEDPKTFSDNSFVENDFVIPGDSTLMNKYADSLPIGFDIKINGITYNKFSIAGSGWLLLKDPAGGTTGANFWHDVLNTGGLRSISSNNEIKNLFSYNHILIAPWFDQQRQIVKDVSTLQSSIYSGIITPTIAERIAQGKDEYSWPFDALDRGVRYKNFYDNIKGRCLVVRWTNADQAYDHRLKFEVKLYENGKIEFLYWPLKKYVETSITAPGLTSTAGIFWSGPTGPSSSGSNKFRDIAPLFSYDWLSRKLLELGGAAYDSTYTESGKNYSWKMSINNWPKNGAIVTFTPPVNLRKFLPRKILASSAKSFLREPGLFDDRKAIDFFQSKNATIKNVHYPSNLPTRLAGDTGSTNILINQQFFTSGSLNAVGSVSSTNINDLYDQIERDPLLQITNRPFNESEKVYDNSTEFYTTGSALTLFGSEFTGPLKSKTQFNIKLPVTKQITMPALTASIYYYDIERQSWHQPSPGDARSPESTSVLHANGDHPSYFGPDDDFYYYKVTESARGFDAVGRKVVSGSRNLDLNPAVPADYGLFPDESTFQTDSCIGLLVNPLDTNANNESIIFSSALEKKYSKSLTDNPDYFPTKAQGINFSTDMPFLIEKIVVEIPFYAEGDWFKDVTTCNRAFGDVQPINGIPSGAIDFGGPGLTVSLLCGRKAPGVSYLDIVASGTITHTLDDQASVHVYKDPGMNYCGIRPIGFRSFSNPTTVVSGTYDGSTFKFDGKVKLELQPSVAGGLTFSRDDRNLVNNTAGHIASNRSKITSLLQTKKLLVKGERNVSPFNESLDSTFYAFRAPYVYLHQISPMSRGTTGVEFNGNSPLGGTVAYVSTEKEIDNPLYIDDTLPAEVTTLINANSSFDAISLYSAVDSRPAPYLLMPGDKLTLSISKTRPVIYKSFLTAVSVGSGSPITPPYDVAKHYQAYSLSGSHNSVVLNTGSIDITLFGSYIQEGSEYHT